MQRWSHSRLLTEPTLPAFYAPLQRQQTVIIALVTLSVIITDI